MGRVDFLDEFAAGRSEDNLKIASVFSPLIRSTRPLFSRLSMTVVMLPVVFIICPAKSRWTKDNKLAILDGNLKTYGDFLRHGDLYVIS